MYKYISKSEKDTINFAKKFAVNLKKGDIIVLSGELGCGKTKFVQGILEYFNIADEISSPTFTIVNEYITPKVKIYHFDVYRLSNSDEFYEMGGDEYFSNGICFIEWGEIIQDILPEHYIQISFKKDDNNENYREILIEKRGK